MSIYLVGLGKFKSIEKWYYQAQPTSEGDLKRMRRIDEWHLGHPVAGARMLRDRLKLEGHDIGRKQVSTLMKELDIQAIYRKANTRRRNLAHRIYPTRLPTFHPFSA